MRWLNSLFSISVMLYLLNDLIHTKIEYNLNSIFDTIQAVPFIISVVVCIVTIIAHLKKR